MLLAILRIDKCMISMVTIGKKKKNSGGGPHGGMFNNFFGGGGRGGKKTGPDYKMTMSVTLNDLYNGVEKSFKVKRKVLCTKCRGTGAKGGDVKKCKSCNGRGHVTKMKRMGPGFNVQMQEHCKKCGGKGKIAKVKCPECRGRKRMHETKELLATIEKGMPDKHEIRFERMSEQTPETIPGDVVLAIKTKRHEQFQRLGNDLHMTMWISLEESLLGFSKEVAQLDGRKITVKRKNVTPHDLVQTIKSEGMPVHNFPSEKGDLHVKYQVTFPQQFTAKQKETIVQLLS